MKVLCNPTHLVFPQLTESREENLDVWRKSLPNVFGARRQDMLELISHTEGDTMPTLSVHSLEDLISNRRSVARYGTGRFCLLVRFDALFFEFCLARSRVLHTHRCDFLLLTPSFANFVARRWINSALSYRKTWGLPNRILLVNINKKKSAVCPV